METKTVVLPKRKKWVPKVPKGGPVKYERTSQQKITDPSMYVSPAKAVKMYQDDSLEKRAAHYYEQQGQVIPEFDKMTKIERLEALNEARKLAIKSRDKLREIDEKQFQSQQKAKVDAEQSKRQPGSAQSGKDSGSTGKDQ